MVIKNNIDQLLNEVHDVNKSINWQQIATNKAKRKLRLKGYWFIGLWMYGSELDMHLYLEREELALKHLKDYLKILEGRLDIALKEDKK